MKRFFIFALLFAVSFAVNSATVTKYGTVTFSTNPSDGDTIAVDSGSGDVTRTFKDTVTTPATQIQIGSDIESTILNVSSHYSKYRLTDVRTSRESASTFRFYGVTGGTLTITVGAWGSVAYVNVPLASVSPDHVVVNSVAAMQLLDPFRVKSVTIRFHTTLGDGGGGQFYSSNESLTEDGGTILGSSHTAGYFWVRDFSGPVLTEWWGANGTDSGDDTAAFNEAIASFNEIMFLPNKTYKIDAVIAGSNYKLRGPGSSYGGTTKIQSFSTNQFAITIGNNSTAVSGIEISGLYLFGNQVNNFGIQVRGNVDGLSIKDCYFSRFKGRALHILGESNPIKNVRISDCSFVQGVEADDDTIQIDQSSSDNVTSISFTDCQGVSTENTNNLLLVDSTQVTMSNCSWDVGTAGAKVRLNKSQSTAPLIYGGQSTITSQAGVSAIRIGYVPGSTAVGTLVPNTLIVGDLEYNDASTTTWSGMAQPQFSSLNFLTASPEGALTMLAGSLSSANISGIPSLYIKGKTATLNNANWVNVMRDRYVDAYGAVGDATTDDTAAIESAMALGGRIVFSAGKIYRITSVLEFTVSDTHLYFEEGAEILMDGNDMAILCDTVLDNISVINGTVRMNGAKGLSNTGIYTINKSRSFYLRDCIAIATNSALDGATIGMNGFSTSQGASGKFENCISSGTTKSGWHVSTGSEFITLVNCVVTNAINTNTGTYGHTPGFDTSGTFIRFIDCRAYDTGGPGFLISADGIADPGTNSCADNVLIQNCETWNPGVSSWSSEGWGLAIRSAFTQWPTNIVVNGMRIYNPQNAALKLEKGEYFDISNVQAYGVNYLGITGVADVRNVRLNNIYMAAVDASTNTTRAFFSTGGTNWWFNNIEIKDFDRGIDHTGGTAMNDVSINNWKYANVGTPFLFNSTHFVTNGHWSLRGPWTTPNDSTHNAAPDGSVWYNTTAGAATALYVKVNGTWTAK